MTAATRNVRLQSSSLSDKPSATASCASAAANGIHGFDESRNGTERFRVMFEFSSRVYAAYQHWVVWRLQSSSAVAMLPFEVSAAEGGLHIAKGFTIQQV